MTRSPKLFQRPLSLEVQPHQCLWPVQTAKKMITLHILTTSSVFLTIAKRTRGRKLEQFVANELKPSFHTLLFGYIDNMELADTDVYRRAGIDRRLFSKIRSNPNYHPSKQTALALSLLALHLSKEQTEEMLASAGHALSQSMVRDIIILFCIEHQIYDLHDVNEILAHFEQPVFGAVL